MKRAIGLIAATLLTTSVYSQEYSGSSSSSYPQNPDSTPADYESRQSEAGAPATSESSSSSSSGYETSPGASGGNSLTGQSNGANIQGDQGEDKTLTTRDSDVSGSEYKGSAESSSSSESSSNLEATGQLRGTGTADGAFHEPAAPVREGSESEGWSGSGTFSGAGPGSVSGSDSSAEVSTELTPPVSESSSSFESQISGNAALENRDDDLSSRGLAPDSNALSREEAFSNSVDGDMDEDQVLIFEDWTIVEPDTSVGGPAGSDSGGGSSSEAGANDSYSRELHQRVQRDWSSRIGTTDVPATPGVDPMTPRVMDHEFDHLRVYNSDTLNGVGAAAGAESDTKSSKEKEDCDEHKGKGSSAEFEEGELKSDSESSTSAPGEYGDRATSENYDDGHLSGNNAADSSESLENSSPSEEGALTQPDL